MTLDNHIIRIDIETVPLRSSEEEAKNNYPDLYSVWCKRYSKDKPAEVSDWDWYWERSPLFPEFSKIVCIAVGRYQTVEVQSPSPETVEGFKVRSYYGDEQTILTQFAEVLNHPSFSGWKLWGHNIKGFDISFLCKRMQINGITVPAMLNVMGKKPWEITHVDTQELRQFGRLLSSSLELMCLALGVESPKEELEGKEVKDIYYSDAPLKKEAITRYCENDVVATYDCYRTILSLM